MDSPVSSARAYMPLLSKKLKKTAHGSSENDIAAVVHHYHRSIDKREKKKDKRIIDPDDLDLMEFDMPAPTTCEKPKNNGCSMRVPTQSRFLHNVSATTNKNSLKQKSAATCKQSGSGSVLSKKHSSKHS